MGVRVIAGERRGKRLSTVAGMATRPTADRVREAIFNILSFRVAQAMVLDMFAGSGAMGIEALSRKARFAVFIDNQSAAVAVIRKNLASCRFENQAMVLQRELPAGVLNLAAGGGGFDLVFLDPPYGQGLILPTLEQLHVGGTLQPGALIVVEHSAAEPISDLPSQFVDADQRRYGKTLVSFIDYII
jgi:16S rRNA (guanine966-N2)-methyltransferase